MVIRELENAIERAANYVWEGEIGIDNLPSKSYNLSINCSNILSYRSSMIDFEREMLIDVLKKTNGNRAQQRERRLSRSAL